MYLVQMINNKTILHLKKKERKVFLLLLKSSENWLKLKFCDDDDMVAWILKVSVRRPCLHLLPRETDWYSVLNSPGLCQKAWHSFRRGRNCFKYDSLNSPGLCQKARHSSTIGKTMRTVSQLSTLTWWSAACWT